MSHEFPDSEGASPLEGRYSNYFKIGFNAFEFLVEFGQLYPENVQTKLHTRIITGPLYAQKLCELLQDSLAKYEQAFGNILNNEAEINPAVGNPSNIVGKT